MGTPLSTFRILSASIKEGSFEDIFGNKKFSPVSFGLNDDDYENDNKDSYFVQLSSDKTKEEVAKAAEAYANPAEYLKAIKWPKSRIQSHTTTYDPQNRPDYKRKQAYYFRPDHYLLLHDIFPDTVPSLPVGEVVVEIFENHPDMGSAPSFTSIETWRRYLMTILDDYTSGVTLNNFPTEPRYEVFSEWYDECEKGALLDEDGKIFYRYSSHIMPDILPLEMMELWYNIKTGQFSGKKINNKKEPTGEKITDIESRDWFAHFRDHNGYYDRMEDYYGWRKEDKSDDFGYDKTTGDYRISRYYKMKIILLPYFCERMLPANRIGVWHENYF